MSKIESSPVEIFKFHINTLNEYDNEVTEELFDHHLKQIASKYGNNSNYVCYVFGMGAHPKSTYNKLKKESDIDVIWFDSTLSGVFKTLTFFIASYAGLVKILDPRKLVSTVKKLSHLSMAGVYIFNQKIEESFVNNIIKNPKLDRGYDFGIKSDSGYFVYIIDTDNEESQTGIYEIVSYGKKAHVFSDVF